MIVETEFPFNFTEEEFIELHSKNLISEQELEIYFQWQLLNL